MRLVALVIRLDALVTLAIYNTILANKLFNFQ